MSETVETLEERVRALADEVVTGTPRFVVEVRVRGARGSRVVEVFVDSDEGIGVDELAEVSRELGFLLETEDVFDSKYNLNVSSPGAARSLTLPRQFRPHIGRDFVVQYRSEDEEPAFAEGRLVAADDEGIELVGEDDQTQRITFELMEDARIRLPW